MNPQRRFDHVGPRRPRRARFTSTKRPVILTQNGRSAAVLLDVEVYESLIDELAVLGDVRTTPNYRPPPEHAPGNAGGLCWLLSGGSMRYRIALHQPEEGYSVSVLGLPGCWSQGATEAEAVENIADAIREYLAFVED